jgi:hypothetical protein
MNTTDIKALELSLQNALKTLKVSKKNQNILNKESRTRINQIIADFCKKNSKEYATVWREVYALLKEKYFVDIYEVKETLQTHTKLEAVERIDMLDKLEKVVDAYISN